MELDALGYRLLLVGRALSLGALWGAVFGEASYAIIILGAVARHGATVPDLLLGLAWSPVAGIVGAVVGGATGLVSGLALALSSHGVLVGINRARLVTGSAAAAVPVAFVLNLGAGVHLIATGIATAAAVTAVLLTPRILHGPPPPLNWHPAMPAMRPPAGRPEQ